MLGIIIGKNSFLASELAKEKLEGDWKYISHFEISDERTCLAKADIVINTAFHPDLKKSKYSAEKDVDLQLIKNIGKDARYIMLSTRMVYGQPPDDILHTFDENSPCLPVNAYGTNKREIEKNITESLGERGIIIRLGNIFGYEPERATFTGTALTSLKKNKKISLNLSPDNTRDFLPVENFSAIINKVCSNPQGGIYNIGSGSGVTCNEAASWLIEGYGEGDIEYTDDSRSGQFILDVSKARNRFDIQLPEKALIKEKFVNCGRKLREKDYKGE